MDGKLSIHKSHPGPEKSRKHFRGGNLKFVGLSWMNFRTDASMMPITPENSRFPRMTTRRDFFRLAAETATLAMLPGRSLAAEQNHRPHETTRVIQRGRPLRDLQQQFVDLRFGMFLHFNMATFQDREWGDPTSSPELFHPTALDTDQWAAAAKSANMTWGCHHAAPRRLLHLADEDPRR
jgi:hypothetical protein